MARQRRLISLWPSMALWRVPKRGPGISLRYMLGTWVILAANASLPMASTPGVFELSHDQTPQRGMWCDPMDTATFFGSQNTS